MDVKKTREELRKGKTIYDMNLRVGYYARVSTDKDDQLNSLENQQNYFEEMIAEGAQAQTYPLLFITGYVELMFASHHVLKSTLITHAQKNIW